MKPTLIVSIPLVWSFRNFIRSGIIENLSQEYRVIIALPETGKENLKNEGISDEDIFILQPIIPDRFHLLLKMLVAGAHELRHPTKSDRIFKDWFNPPQKKKKDLGLLIKNTLFTCFVRLAAIKPFYLFFKHAEYKQFCRIIPESTYAFLKKANPVLGISTNCVVSGEWPLFRAMHKLGVKTVSFVSSFDNITSRGFFPLSHFNHYMVWQKQMENDLIHFYNITRTQITITGTPQFDFHLLEKFSWSQAKTTEMLNLDGEKPYFVYCANHFNITPNEPELVEQIISYMSDNDELNQHPWVIRLHPMDKYHRWDTLKKSHDSVVFSYPWRHDDDVPYWAVPSNDDIALLGNTLKYAEATISVASTIALDSAVVDTPVICIGFHTAKDSSEDRFYHDVHFSHHYEPIMSSGATPLATNMGSLANLLLELVSEPELLRKKRGELVKNICGVVDGKAVDRVTRTILNLA